MRLDCLTLTFSNISSWDKIFIFGLRFYCLFLVFNCQYVIIDSDNSLVLNSWQAISRTNVYHALWYHMKSLGLNELTETRLFNRSEAVFLLCFLFAVACRLFVLMLWVCAVCLQPHPPPVARLLSSPHSTRQARKVLMEKKTQKNSQRTGPSMM